jgi:putative spermidine/putrescine transport system substrate-binding protein
MRASALLGIVLLLTGCGPAVDNTDWLKADFAALEKQARGSEASFYMWGGSQMINGWIDGPLAEALQREYGMSLKRVPMDASVFINKLLTEKQAGRRTGSMDLIWINGENFKNAREAGLLFGPFAGKLPNFGLYVDEGTVRYDFGYPIDGYEAPYGRAQFVFEYDAAKTVPPHSFTALESWVREHPGRFTYPQPPDFTGSAFIRQLFYALAGGHEQFAGGFDAGLFEEKSQLLWEYLNRIEPYLWQEGRTYPRDLAALDTLFERGAVDINMSYTQTNVQSRIDSGRYPSTARSFLMEEGSLFNTHFTAIPFNAPNKPGAMVLANLLLSVELQYSKNLPANWGDFTVLDMKKLPEEWRARFEALELGEATLPLKLLEERAVPEVSPAYVEALELGWEANVLKR